MTPTGALQLVADVEAAIDRGREVIASERLGLEALEGAIDKTFADACAAIAAARRQVVFTGVGKSGHIARKIAATFAATGTPAIYVHASEAGHGDMGMLVEGDVLVVLSNSGNTAELRAIVAFARRKHITVIGVASERDSFVIRYADIALLLPQVKEACSANIAPTTSTTMQLALGDALAMTVMDLRGITRDQLHALHPAGRIGLSLAPVHEIMQGSDRMPLVRRGTTIPDTLSTMTSGCFGLAGVVDEAGHLIGIITDGDLRRHFDELGTALAGDVMTPSPKTIPAEMTAGDALAFLNSNQITAAFVVGDPTAGDFVPLGIIHIHDLLRHGLR